MIKREPMKARAISYAEEKIRYNLAFSKTPERRAQLEQELREYQEKQQILDNLKPSYRD